MGEGANFFRLVCAVVALQGLFPVASLAADGEDPARQAGEDLWVPSLAITSGVTIQQQKGSVDSVLFEDMNPVSIPLEGAFDDDDLAVSPFVGGSLEVMTPALPIPLRPRLFLSGEILPTFASDRDVVSDGNPGCIRGPRIGDPCVEDIPPGAPLDHTFDQGAANGEGSVTTAQVDTLVFGASLGVAFPARIGKRQLRIKPSVGWISYKVDAGGIVVHAACVDYPPQPQTNRNKCTITTTDPQGFLRDTTLMGGASQRFHGIGPGLDVEMDTVRYGPLGVSLFLGARAYRVLGNRKISFGASETFNDDLGMDVANAAWEVEVNPWLFRGHVGIRFQWLGSGN